ncbi:AAA family ATPase [Streptomyces abikoensis]|uniref:AAA family ATPase n=1 Tax=Streptomyces abikoensis TaxID=97398 RepID=UPI00371C3066
MDVDVDHIRGSAPVATATTPQGLTDLRGQEGPPLTLSYPPGTVLIVSGLPGSGKSTLLRRLTTAAPHVPAVDPRTSHEACEAVMPTWLPYAVYRPWARAKHFRRLRAEVRGGRAFLVHDCGSRAWMRRWLAREAARQGHELHLILLDVTATEALAGQEARGRWAPRRVFDKHRRGLDRLLGGLSGAGGSLPEAASVVLLDRVSRERVTAVEFAPDAG